MRFEIEVHENDAGEWVASAVHYQVTATGRTEKEALARMMEALALHFERASR